MADLFLTKLTRCWREDRFADSVEKILAASLKKVSGHKLNILLSSTPGCPLGERKPSIDSLRMRRVFRIISNKLDHKQNKGLTPFEVKGEHTQYYNKKSLRRVYDYQVFRVI